MLVLMGLLVLFFNGLDNLTTFFCLRSPVDSYEVSEANPVAAWLFDSLGLINGLVLEMTITSLAVGFLVFTSLIPTRVKWVTLTVMMILPAWASLNNFNVMADIGVSFSLN